MTARGGSSARWKPVKRDFSMLKGLNNTTSSSTTLL